MTPTHIQTKADQVLGYIQQGLHPLKIRGRKLREYANCYSIPLPNGYRLLLRFTDQLEKYRIVTHNTYDNLLKRHKVPF